MTIADTPLIRLLFPTLGIPHLPWGTIPPQPPKLPSENPHSFRQNAAVLEDLDWWLWKLWFDIGSCGLTSEESSWKSRTSEESAYMFERIILICFYSDLFSLLHNWAVCHHLWCTDVVFKPHYYYIIIIISCLVLEKSSSPTYRVRHSSRRARLHLLVSSW